MPVHVRVGSEVGIGSSSVAFLLEVESLTSIGWISESTDTRVPAPSLSVGSGDVHCHT